MARVIIPTPLRKFTQNLSSIETNGGTVIEAITSIADKHPEVRPHLFEENGNIRGFVRIYVGDEDINALENEQTIIGQDTVVSIVPAIAGGKQ
ncbi:MAG: molybdopterin synthase sulfur carrier subunit [Flavobacteriales bacterium]|nr:MAG: molybdopterin synthase sulfur carrier subunit [Flavobacteriales bacterium]